MESKQIYGIVIACLAVCILIGILSAIKKDTPTSPQDETLPPVTNTAIQMPTTTTDFWDAIAAQQQSATETTTTVPLSTDSDTQQQIPQTDENGETLLPIDGTDVTGIQSDITGETTAVSSDLNSAPQSDAGFPFDTTTTHPNIREDGYHIIVTN